MPFFSRRKRSKRDDEGAGPPPTSHSNRTSEAGDATGVDPLASLQDFEKAHTLDPNLPLNQLNEIEAALAAGDAELGQALERDLVEDNNPYPEVRATIPNFDVEMPANTIRAWVIGMVLCTIASGYNALLSMRNPQMLIATFIVQLVAYPLGLGWDLIFPDREWRLFGLKFNLKPGPFNVKEHVIITVMSNAAYGRGSLAAMDVILAQKMFYGQDFGWAYQLLFGITTLCMGFGLAGLARRFLVWPASMIWPSTLVNASLFYTLHNHSPSDPAETNGWRIGRYRWFLIIGIGSFVWYWFPGWIFQGLSYFTFVTWIAPENVLLNQLFGASSGYGILPITFDWSVISRLIGSPLIPPFHAIANTVAGVLVLFTALSMGIHYSRIWYGQYFPVQSATAFDNTAQSYNISMVLDENYRFVEEKYHAYSPVYLSTQYAIGFGASFASISAVIVHVALYHGRDIWRQLRFPREHESDVHMRLMRKYRDAEDWWYAALFVVMIGVSFAVCCGWPTGLPWWAFIVCIIILVIWTVPIGIVQAITNMQLSLNVLSEFVIGYMLPGRPPAMMLFKNYATYSLMQALVFAEDLKLGHYMKVPPRTMFASQLVAAIWSAIVQIAVLNWAQAVIPNACQFFGQPSNYTCPGSRFMLNASIIWGAIGPARIFSNGALYSGLQWFWLVGAVTPVITWYFARKKPKSVWRYLHMPVFFGGSGLIPPATVYHYLCWGIVGTVFNWFIKRRWTGWWLNYNYITSAALDCGVILSSFIIFLALALTSAMPPLWYGNIQVFSTLDTNFMAVQENLPPGATIGPSVFP